MTAVMHLDVVPASRPRPRPSVRRPELVAALTGPDAPPLAVLIAPAGFGKTTVLLEWAATDPRPFAWITLDRHHDDPRVLLQTVARAVDAASAEAADGRIVLVLDNVDRLRSPLARDTIAAIATDLPDTIAIALASRSELPLPVARLRAQGLVTELRHDELAMTRADAASLLRAAGLHLEREDVGALMHRTEGWPAGLSLAALSLVSNPAPGSAIARFTGLDRLVAEYLRDEVLAPLEDDEREFVLRSSVLDMLSGPACEAVLGLPRASDTLARLLRSGFPFVALDRTAERHRHHRLLDELLQAELRRDRPELVAELHRRACAWYAREDDRDRALQHALAADEVERAGELVLDGVPGSVEQGACATVEHWLSHFTDRQIAGHPQLALPAAGVQLIQGRGDRAEHLLASIDPEREGRDVAGGVAALRAALGRDGLAQMADDALRGAELLAPHNPCQALCALVAGVAEHLSGEPDSARRRLEDGARRAAVSAPQVHALCLAQLALLALEDHDLEGAARLATRARSQIARYGLARYPTSALALAVSALVRAQRGRVEDARSDARAAAALLERLTDFAHWYEAEVQLVLGRAAPRLSDVGETRRGSPRPRRLATRLPEAAELLRWLQEAEADLEAFTTAASLPSSLTTAELRSCTSSRRTSRSARSPSARTCRPTRSRPRPTPSIASSTCAPARRPSRVPALWGSSTIERARRAIDGYGRHACGEFAAALAYRILFSLVPFVALLATLLPESARVDVVDWLLDASPGATVDRASNSRSRTRASRRRSPA